MKSKQFNNKYIIRIDKGEELVSTLKQFCEKEDIKLAYIHGLGATNEVTVGLYDVKTKEYHSKDFKKDFEIVPVFGFLNTMNGETYLHLHANLADKEHRSFGGHLNKAVISATFEAVVEVIDGEIDRFEDPDTGLNLLDL